MGQWACLLFLVEHGEGKDEIIFGLVGVRARLLYYFDELLELYALLTRGERW